MAKAQIVTSKGTRVSFEGSTEEVASLVARFEGNVPAEPNPTVDRRDGKSKLGPQDHISMLIDQGFFRKPQGLGTIRAALEELGHFYAVTSLSPAVLRLVRKRQLRRIKEKKLWAYVQ